MIRSETAVRAAGLPWTILRPVSFMTNTFEWLPQLQQGEVVRAPFAEVAIATIDPADLAAVAAEALLSDGHDGQAYALTGPEARMLAAMPERYVNAFFSFFVDGTLDETTVQPTVAEVTGRPPRTFRHWTEENADAFTR